jgi:putative membrane protein
MSDQEWRRRRIFVAWGIFGLIVLIGISIIASLLFFGLRTSGTFYPFFPAFFFPFHFGWLGGIFIILVFFLIARWFFLPWRNGNTSGSYRQHSDDNSARNILKERYAKGEITKEQFEQMMLDLKRSE